MHNYRVKALLATRFVSSLAKQKFWHQHPEITRCHDHYQGWCEVTRSDSRRVFSRW